MDYRNSRRKPIHLGKAIGHGGEATIYKVIGQPKILAKLYDQPPRKEYARKLVWMRDHPPNDPTAAQQHASLAWPVDLLFGSNGRLSGYLMPYIEHAVTLLDVFNPRRCAEILPEFNRRYLHRAARNLASALGALHAGGYVVGDVNESNILVTARALVTMIDTDSFQVRETGIPDARIYTCPVARLEYTPPELQGKSLQNTERTSVSDTFGLGVLIYQLLMSGNHPFRAQWLGSGEPPPLEERIRQGCFPFRTPPTCPVAPPPSTHGLEVLYPGVANLVLRCFVDGHSQPQQRPTPDQWEKAIGEAEENLVLCQNGHYYSNHLSECPVCNPRFPGRQVPLPAVAEPRTTRQSPTDQHFPPPLKNPVPAVPANPVGGKSLLALTKSTLAAKSGTSHRRSVHFNRQSLLTSLGRGALLGGGAGALGGGLVAMISWGISQELSWDPLFTTGLVLAAAWRSIQIGLGLCYTVVRTVGWGKALRVGLCLFLAGVGVYLGGKIAPLSQAIGIGGLLGALMGWLLGDVLWHRKPHLRWDWVGTGAVVLFFGWLAYSGGAWLGNHWPGTVFQQAYLNAGRLA